MGLFNKKNDSQFFALAIVNYYSGKPFNPFYNVRINRLVSSHSKKECLMEAVRLCGEPKTNDQLYIISQSYVLAGADYRPQAIMWLNKFISAGAVWSGTPRGMVTMEDYVESQLSMSIAEIWYQLGRAYEGEYQFENALSAFIRALNTDNFYTPAVAGVSDVYLKMNRIDDGIRFLTGIKKTGCKDMKVFAKSKIEELKSKKANGYVYKPRPRKRAANSSQPL